MSRACSGARAPGRAVASALAFALLAGCGESSPDAPDAASVDESLDESDSTPPAFVLFKEQAADAGLSFEHVSGHDGEHWWMPEIMGGGAALLDADADGRLDVYFVQSGRLGAPADAQPGNQLFRNLGELRFEDVSAGSGADDRGYGMGAAVGDVDDDGLSDLYVTNVGANVLLRSHGDGTFRDITAGSATGDPGWGTSAAFLDADADGDLDLFVVNYLEWTAAGELTCHNEQGTRDYCSPQSYEAPARDVLYRNDGAGVFSDVSVSSGIAAKPSTGLGIGCGDFDLDGRMDVFVANDGMADHLWTNRGDLRFEDTAMLAGCAVDDSGRAKAGMGVALGDVDDDGDLDLAVCNLAGQSDSFYINEGGWFRDQTATTGLAAASRARTRFGFGLFDFDTDGALDLFQANGRVAVGTERHGADPYAEPDLLLLGERGADGSLRLRPASTADGTAEAPAYTSRAAAFGDLDDDGGVDVIVVNRDGPARLLWNSSLNRFASHGGEWIGFSVLERSGRHALGATVSFDDVTAPGQAHFPRRHMTRVVRAGSSYQASNDPRVHFGTGRGSATDVTVTWADGVVETFGDYRAKRYDVLRRGAGETR